jgi:hypothetical protein
MDARLPATGADPVEQARGDQRLRAGLSSSVAVICASLAFSSVALAEDTAPVDAAAAAPVVEVAPAPAPEPAPVAEPTPPPPAAPVQQQAVMATPTHAAVPKQIVPKKNENNGNPNAPGQSGGQGNENRGDDNPNNGQGNGGKVTICHQTGSANNPFTVITTASEAVINAHTAHGDQIIGAGGTCGQTPGGETPGGETPGGETPTTNGETPTTNGETPVGEQEVLGDREEGEQREEQREQDVAGDRAERERDAAPTATRTNAVDSPAVEVAPAAGDELPFTGFAALYAALAGLFMLMTGIALRAYERVRNSRS